MTGGQRLLRAETRGPAAAAVLVVLVLLTLGASLAGGKVFGSGDNIFQWIPFSAETPAGWIRPSNPLLTDPVVTFNPALLVTRSELADGVLPLWNPYVGAGRPLLFQQQAPLFPITWLAYVLPFWRSLAWIAAAKILAAACGVYLFSRELGMRRSSSLLGSIVFPFGSYFFVWLQHPHTNVWTMLPWMFLAARRVCTRGRYGATALLGTAGGLACLGGHPESTSIVFTATLAYGAFELLSNRGQAAAPSVGGRTIGAAPMRLRHSAARWEPTPRGRLLLFAAGLGLGLGVGAIVILPFSEALGVAPPVQRGGAPGAPFQFLWTFFFPELWGSPNKLFSAGLWNFNERTTYVGALPLLFAIATLGRRRPREQWFFIGVVALLLITIFNVPFWAQGVADLPGVKLVWLARLRIVVSFAASVLAAYGLDRWVGGSARERRKMLWLMGVGALIPLLAWLPRHTNVVPGLGSSLAQLPAVHFNQQSVSVVEFGSVLRWALICGVGLGALILVRRRRTATAAVMIVIVLTGSDLVTLDHSYHGSIPLSEASPPTPTSIRYLQSHQGDARVTASDLALPSDLNERYGLRDPRIGFDIPPLRYQLLWTSLGGVYGGGGTALFDANAFGAHRLADIFATRYVLLAPGASIPSWLHVVLTTRGATVASNPTALARTWVAYSWQPAASRSDALTKTLHSTTESLRDQPVIEGAPSPPTTHAMSPSSAQVVADDPGAVAIRAVARNAGYLVLDDSAYPGWTATVDGRSAAWRPANEDFRAVAVTAGRHIIRFTYRPGSVLLGAIITSFSVLTLLVLAWLGLVGRRQGDYGRKR